jgi:hypothetical protein
MVEHVPVIQNNEYRHPPAVGVVDEFRILSCYGITSRVSTDLFL